MQIRIRKSFDGDTSLREFTEHLREAFYKYLEETVDCWGGICDIYDDHIVYDSWTSNKLFRVNYVEESDGSISFTNTAEVRRVYVPIESAKSTLIAINGVVKNIALSEEEIAAAISPPKQGLKLVDMFGEGGNLWRDDDAKPNP